MTEKAHSDNPNVLSLCVESTMYPLTTRLANIRNKT